MHKAVLDLNSIVSKNSKAKLLGTGMHPLLKLNQTASGSIGTKKFTMSTPEFLT
jgi:hypothetical protein